MKERFKSWEYHRTLENAERLMEMKLLGWSFRAINSISSPFNLDDIVDESVRAVIGARGTSHLPGKPPKPTLQGYDDKGHPEYGTGIVLAMRTISQGGFYAECARRLTEAWDEYYRKEALH